MGSGAAVDDASQDGLEDSAGVQRAAEDSASRIGSQSMQGLQMPTELSVSQGSRSSPRVKFLPDDANLADSKATGSSQKPALNAKVAHLRRLHARWLQAPQEDNPDDKGQETDSISESFVSSHSSHEIESHAPLSTHMCGRMPDETDVLAALCPSWQGGLLDEGIVPHGQIREQQMREAEAVQRALWKRRYFIDPSIVENALVSPDQHLPDDAQPLNVKRVVQRNPFDRVLHEGHLQTKQTKHQRRGNGRRM